jgi:hypothetical protein
MAPSRREAKFHARRGEAAFRRSIAGPTTRQDAEFAAAVDDLTMALHCLAPEDPMHADVSFLLGAVRLASHDKQCGEQCPAPREFAQIIDLIAAGGARDGAPARQMSLYAIALDKLYDHTRDPADIDIAIEWLSRAARDRRLAAADRRRMLIDVAVQHANRGEATRASQSRSGPGTESWAAFDAAITQFGKVLAMTGGQGGWRDGSRATDRLDAWLGQLETYYQRGGGAARDEDLDPMAGLARALTSRMVPDYHVRPYALGRAGVMLIERLARQNGDPWDLALNTAVSSAEPGAISAAVGRVPSFGPDLELAIGALAQAVRLTAPDDRRHPAYTAALCAAHGMRYLAFLADHDLQEVGRLGRAVLGSPHGDPVYRRQCSEWLLAVLARRVAGADTAAAPGLRSGWRKPTPSADGDLDMMLGLLAGFAAEDGATLAPALSAFLTDSMLTRAEGDLSNTELSAEYARAHQAAADLASIPAAHAALLLRAAEIGAQLVYRGVAPTAVVDEVAAAFDQACRGLPAGHPLAREAAARAAAFQSALPKPPGQAPPGLEAYGPDMPERVDGAALHGTVELHDTAEEFPPVLEVFSVRALAALGVGIQGWLAGTAGRTEDAASALLVRQPQGSARRAAVLCVLGLAQYEVWLRERAGGGLRGPLDHVRGAISELTAECPLRSRLTLLLARMLLDRAQTGGDLADADAALTLLTSLRGLAGAEPNGLGELLAQAGPPQLAELLAVRASGSLSAEGAAGYWLDLEAAIGSARLLRGILAGSGPGPLDTGSPGSNDSGRCDEDIGEAIAILRSVADSLPAPDRRRPGVLSDLGLALLAGSGELAAAEVLHEAAASVVASPGHPQQAAILLRAAAAFAVKEQATAGMVAVEDHADHRAYASPRVVDDGISLLTRALSGADLASSGERSRCLYGLGAIKLIRFSRSGRPADLSHAIVCLEQARVGVEAFPGDPFLVPLLRALAWAHRQDAYRQAREQARAGKRGWALADEPRLPLHQSRSTGRSLLYAHAQSVLLQSGSRHALAASRAVGHDALTLAEWCIADGRPDSAIEALELGRALVLHAATVAADIPTLLRESGHPELAARWGSHMSPARVSAGNLDTIPGDLRSQVLAALRTGAADRRLLAAPSVADITSTLRLAGLDALVYLVPAAGVVRGRALIVGADGTARASDLPGLAAGPGTPVSRFAAADQQLRATRSVAGDDRDMGVARRFMRELDGICEWAWAAAIGPLLAQLATGYLAREVEQERPLRVALVPIGVLGCIPWHAARRGEPGQARYACADVIFTTCASARQLIEAAGRPRLEPGAGPAVFVANPSGDLSASQLEADAICAAFYHDAVYLGRSTRTPVSGSGSPNELLACLPGGDAGAVRPAVLHLGCHAIAGTSPEESRLVLADGQVLPISQILAQANHRDRNEPGGLVVLAACTSDLALADYEEALTLASAFLATGARGAVGARWAVNDQVTALLMFMFHRHLIRAPGDGPAGALRAAQLWMLNPDREIPPEMPGELARLVRSFIRHPYAWAAFTCHGR